MNRNDVSGRSKLFEVLIDLSKKNVVILGDDRSDEEVLSIAHRLLPCTDHLTVLTASPSSDLRQLAAEEHFSLIKREYIRDDLYGADVVICTLRGQKETDDVHAVCRTLGVRLCILSQPERSDFILAAETKETSRVKTENGPDPDDVNPASEKKKVTIYTDGSARGNPDGPGGYGAIIEYTDSKGQLHTKELSQGYEKTTNNRMELMGAIAALEALNTPCEVELWSDSKYLTDAFNQHWIDSWKRRKWMRSGSEPVKNVDLWQRLLAAAGIHQVSWKWVRGHNGHPQNERCDALATAAADSSDRIPDPGVNN